MSAIIRWTGGQLFGELEDNLRPTAIAWNYKRDYCKEILWGMKLKNTGLVEHETGVHDAEKSAKWVAIYDLLSNLDKTNFPLSYYHI